jgi:hypothetical protein
MFESSYGFLYNSNIFIITVPFFYHKTLGFYLCYLPNIESKWNKFKWKILENSNYDNFHGGGDFSHSYVIMHKYFGKKKKCKKWVHKFYIQFNMFSYMKISCTFFWHLGPQILNFMNIKNQLDRKKESFSLLPF